jgi:hypothetical protein
MARTWLSVTVELLGGRGHELWPYPGRVFAVGPSHTFGQLADAINDAFARWDRSHVTMVTLADGRVVTDVDTGLELAGSPDGALLRPLDMTTTTVSGSVGLGAEFQFTFDLGDRWTHRCVVEEYLVDPIEVLGAVPPGPLPSWGWGELPDQYGRRWSDDDGQSRAPKRPAHPHPMLIGLWPAHGQVRDLDLTEVRKAIAAKDVSRFLAALSGRDIDDALQQIAAGLRIALAEHAPDAETTALSVVNRLTSRGAAGDQVLADELLALLRGETPAGQPVPVDLEMLAYSLDRGPEMSLGVYVDLVTGDVLDESETDPLLVGEDAAVDVEAEPDRWLFVHLTESREQWLDMEAFAESQHDQDLRERLERAIEGRGAFRRFRDLLHEEDLEERWNVFSTDRQIGRAREALADSGFRAVPG